MTFPITKYPGNKATAGYYQKIINLMPPHQVYIEPFLGSGGIMRKKEPAKVSIGYDLNKKIIDKWCNSDLNFAANFLCDDGLKGIAEWNRYTMYQTILFFIDPPYQMETRKSKKNIYMHESHLQLHIDLLKLIKKTKHMVMLCGYENDLYNYHLQDWNKIQIKRSVHGKPATEIVWFNFPAPKEIAQYTFLGDNRTDRQRIKRKVNRWVNNFSNLPVLEQSLIYKELSKKKLLQ